jgi:hypothetical protein
MDLSTGDFTVECWVYTFAVTGYTQPIVSSQDFAAHGIQMSLSHASPSLMQFGVGFASMGIAFGAAFVSPNTWYHVAMVRKGNVFDCFLNGVPSGGPVTLSGSIGTDTNFTIHRGNAFGAGFDGQIDELRICKTAVYTPGVAFTPATAPFNNPQIIYNPMSLYYPGRGQYWLWFGSMALVLTINGTGTKTWSRYFFPDAITDWTLSAGVLYLRTAGNLVLKLDPTAPTGVDDYGGSPVTFDGLIQWPYLNMGGLGINKMMVGIDVVGDGNCVMQVGFNQSDDSTFNDNPNFSTSTGVTTPYAITLTDTVPGEPLPFPCNAPSYSVILKFPGNLTTPNDWSWEACNIYLSDQGGGGALG